MLAQRLSGTGAFEPEELLGSVLTMAASALGFLSPQKVRSTGRMLVFGELHPAELTKLFSLGGGKTVGGRGVVGHEDHLF